MIARKLFSLAFSLLCGLSALTLPVVFLSGSISVDHTPSAHAAGFSEPSVGKTIYVDINKTSGNHTGINWANAYQSLQPALDEALPGDKIWVASGIYNPTHRTTTDMRSKTFTLTPGVALYGSFKGNENSLSQRDWRAHPSVLSGDLAGNDSGFTNNGENSYHVVTSENVTETARLDGFIIQGGNANSHIAPDYFGGGLYNSSGNPSLVNLIFYQNYAEQSGGGFYNISGNSLIANCAWIGNVAGWGGGLRNKNSAPTLVNTLFDGNSSFIKADAIHNSNSNPIIINSTIAHNLDASDAGGIVSDTDSHPIIKNSILWQNGDFQILNVDTSTAEVHYSLMQDTPTEASCDVTSITCYGVKLNVNPLFINPPGIDGISGTLDDNLRLSAASPAINAGDNDAVPQDDLDINYNGIFAERLPDDRDDPWRVAQSGSGYIGSGTPPIVDMGAYEAKNNLFLPSIRK
jgi:hypothetical protein